LRQHPLQKNPRLTPEQSRFIDTIFFIINPIAQAWLYDFHPATADIFFKNQTINSLKTVFLH